MSDWKPMGPKSAVGDWKPMRTISEGAGDSFLPGARGRYLLWLEPPMVTGDPHWVHFSWREESFCIRDFINGRERRQDPTLNATQVWRNAKRRIPCKGELYKPVEDFDFWKRKLEELSKEDI